MLVLILAISIAKLGKSEKKTGRLTYVSNKLTPTPWKKS
jgi:hypothetical protein